MQMLQLNPYQIADAFPEESRDLIPKFLKVLKALEWSIYEKEKLIMDMPVSAQEKSLYMMFAQTGVNLEIRNRIRIYEKVMDIVNNGYSKDLEFNLAVKKAKLSPIEGMYQFQRLRSATNRIHCSCPFHGEDKHPSFVVYKENNTFHCFTCKISGDAIDFFALINKVKFTDAIKALS